MLYKFQKARRAYQVKTVPFRAVLGDASNNPYAEFGMYWVRRKANADPNDLATTGAPFRVRAGSAIIVPRGGRVVWVERGKDTHLTVTGYDHDDLVAAGIDPRGAQPNDPYREWIRFKQIQNFRALPLATTDGDSMKVQVRQLAYYDGDGNLVLYHGTNAAIHIDLTDYTPGANFQRYVVLWLRTYNPFGLEPIQVTVSTPIDSIDEDLAFEDMQECADQADYDAIPIQSFRLANGQTTLKLVDTVDFDLRQFINMPHVFGFPNPVARHLILRGDRQQLFTGSITVSGELTVEGEFTGVELMPDAGGGSGSGGTGTVTSVGLTMPAEFGVSGSPVTASGTLAVSKANQSANQVYAGPASGSPAAPAFRALNNDDIPGTLSGKTITGGAIDNTPIGGTTPAAGYFSDLRVKVGSFLGRMTHAITAARTWTFPDATGTVVLEDNTATITNKTFTSPVINTGVSGSAIDNDATLAANSTTLLPTQQAVKSYVDAVAQGLSPKYSVLAATAAALAANTYNNGTSGVGATITANANGALTVDGVTVAVNDRVLVKNESTASRNGIYVVTATGSAGAPFVLTRSLDMNQPAEIPGAFVFTENGTVNDGAGFVVADPGPFTIGTTAIPWTQFSGAGQITVTSPIVKTGNNISFATPGAGAYRANGIALYQTNSTSFVNVDNTNMNFSITTTGGNLKIGFAGSIENASGAGQTMFDIELDGTRLGTDDGIMACGGSGIVNASFVTSQISVAAGAHTVKLQWKVLSGTTVNMFNGTGAATPRDTHPQFWVEETH